MYPGNIPLCEHNACLLEDMGVFLSFQDPPASGFIDWPEGEKFWPNADVSAGFTPHGSWRSNKAMA
jgi:hypothetical protein